MDARKTRKSGQMWRVRFINEKSGHLNKAFYRTSDSAFRRATAVKENVDMTFVDLSYWHYGLEAWVVLP